MEQQMGYGTVSVRQAADMMRSGRPPVVLDVREAWERNGGALPGSLAIPASRLEDMAPRLMPDRQRPVLVYCHTGAHSWQSAERLWEMGYAQVYDMMGGFLEWRMAWQRGWL